VVAVTVAVALALTCTAAAQAPPGSSRNLKTGLLAYEHTGVQAKPVPGLRPGVDANEIIIPEGNAPSGTKEGELGWLICLYHSQNWCIADADDPGDVAKAAPNGVKAPPNGSDLVILENVVELTGAALSILQAVVAAAPVVAHFIKRLWYGTEGGKGKHVGFAPEDGQCVGVWGYDEDSTLGSCSSAHGIYWQMQQIGSSPAFRMWDTYSKGDMIAANLDEGTRLFAHSPEDWSTWTGVPVCYVNCD
jgi:hypothetical protein